MSLNVLRKDVKAILSDHDLPDFVKEQKVLALLDEYENQTRLFISIHENEGKNISPKLARKELLGE